MQNDDEMYGMDSMDGMERLPFRTKVSDAVFFMKYLKPLLWMVISVTVINLMSASSLIPIMDFGRILGDYFGNKESVVWRFVGSLGPPQYDLHIYITIAAFLILVAGAISLLSNYMNGYVREFLMRNLRFDVYKSLKHLNMQDVNKRGAGDYVQEIHRDVYSVDQLFSELFSRALPQIIFAGVAFAILLNINWSMTLIIFVSGIILFPLFSTCNRKVNDLSEVSRDTFIGISDHLVETIGGFRDIIALGHFDRFSRRFEELLKRAQACGVSLAWWGQVGGIVTVSIMSLFSAVPIIVVIPKLLKAQAAGQSGEVTYLIGSTISYVLFLQQFLQVYNIAYHFLEQVAATSPSLHSLRKTVGVCAGKPVKRAASFHSDALSPVESICFDDVSMNFDGYPVFEGIGFEIPGGKISAIVGQSGSGKTTIFNLLLGLLEPTGGTISINGQPLEAIDEKQIKKMMGLIPQDPFIFNCSIRENLLMASTEIPDEQTLDRAIRLSQLQHFIETHEEGLDFIAGHMGRNLSAGEKQRLALARLVLQDPAIIICDEYTANIDLKIAGLIHDVMRDEFSGRTRIIISHQLYTIRGADHIIVLDHGAIAEAGTHEELLGMGGVYRSLWDLQKLA